MGRKMKYDRQSSKNDNNLKAFVEGYKQGYKDGIKAANKALEKQMQNYTLWTKREFNRFGSQDGLNSN